MPVATVDAGAWTPDTPNFGPGGLATAQGVKPIGGGGYGRILEPVNSGDAITAAQVVHGMMSVNNDLGVEFIIVGTDTSLWSRLSTTGAVVDRSLLAGFPYTVTANNPWSFAVAGNEVFAATLGEPIQTINVLTMGGGGNFALLGGTPPQGQNIAIFPPGFMVVGNITGGLETRVHWSEFDNFASWPTPATDAARAALSDFEDLSLGGGNVVALHALQSVGLVFQQRSIRRFEFVGGDTIWNIRTVSSDLQLLNHTQCNKAIVERNGLLFFPTEEGFFATDGFQMTPIGHGAVDRFFAADLDQSGPGIIGAKDDTCIYWAYSSVEHATGGLDRMLVFCPQESRWSFVDLNQDDPPEGGLVGRGLPATAESLVTLAYMGDVAGTRTVFEASANQGTRAPYAAEFLSKDLELTVGRASTVTSLRPLAETISPYGANTNVRVRTKLSHNETPGTLTTPRLLTDDFGAAAFREIGRLHALTYDDTESLFESFTGWEVEFSADGKKPG